MATHEELYLHISAETFETVDAAVALIELLVTPVSGNPAAVSTTPTSVSGTKRAADSAVSQEFGSATTASQIVGRPPIRPYRRNNLVN